MRWLQKAGTASFVKFPFLIQFLLNSRDFGFAQICSIGGGHLSREALRNLPGAREGLVRKYIDKHGKRRHGDVPSRLKGSQ